MLSIVSKKISSNYDKTMENVRKRIHVRLVNNAKECEKYVNTPRFVSQKIFSENLVDIHDIKPVLLLKKPLYVGFSILDLTNLLMYEFHHNYFKTKYKHFAKLLFTDADS